MMGIFGIALLLVVASEAKKKNPFWNHSSQPVHNRLRLLCQPGAANKGENSPHPAVSFDF